MIGCRSRDLAWIVPIFIQASIHSKSHIEWTILASWPISVNSQFFILFAFFMQWQDWLVDSRNCLMDLLELVWINLLFMNWKFVLKILDLLIFLHNELLVFLILKLHLHKFLKIRRFSSWNAWFWCESNSSFNLSLYGKVNKFLRSYFFSIDLYLFLMKINLNMLIFNRNRYHISEKFIIICTHTCDQSSFNIDLKVTVVGFHLSADKELVSFVFKLRTKLNL